MRLGPCPSRSGALRLKRHQPQFVSEHPAQRRGEKLASLGFADQCWPRAACWQTVTGRCCTWHRGPRRTRQGCRKSFQDPRQRGLPDRLSARGSKGPKQGRGAISRRSAGTPASGGRYSRWHPQRVERFQPLYKLRDNGPNSASGSPNQAEGRIQVTTFGRLRVARSPLFGNFS